MTVAEAPRRLYLAGRHFQTISGRLLASTTRARGRRRQAMCRGRSGGRACSKSEARNLKHPLGGTRETFATREIPSTKWRGIAAEAAPTGARAYQSGRSVLSSARRMVRGADWRIRLGRMGVRWTLAIGRTLGDKELRGLERSSKRLEDWASMRGAHHGGAGGALGVATPLRCERSSPPRIASTASTTVCAGRTAVVLEALTESGGVRDARRGASALSPMAGTSGGFPLLLQRLWVQANRVSEG